MADPSRAAPFSGVTAGIEPGCSWGGRPHDPSQRKRTRTVQPRTPRERVALVHATTAARTAVEDAAHAAAEAAARARRMAEALNAALELLNAVERAPDPAPLSAQDTERPIAALSQREQEVLALVAEGRSNKAIAEALYVSTEHDQDARGLAIQQVARRKACAVGRHRRPRSGAVTTSSRICRGSVSVESLRRT